MSQILEQLDNNGYTIIPNFIDKQLTARIREHMDSLLPPISPREGEISRTHTLRHPIPGEIMAEILNRPALLDLAKEILYSQDLRLLEQVLIRTDSREAKPEDAGPTRATHWHIDKTFLPEHYNARPRQTYFHMVHALSNVPKGGGGTTVIPGSHKKSFAAAEKIGTVDGLDELKQNPIEVAGLDLNDAIELHPTEGDLLVFNPMCLHSASSNISDSPRYVYFASFYDSSAQYLQRNLTPGNHYSNVVPDSLRDNLPAELQSLLGD